MGSSRSALIDPVEMISSNPKCQERAEGLPLTQVSGTTFCQHGVAIVRPEQAVQAWMHPIGQKAIQNSLPVRPRLRHARAS
jgi:hypothetical protein